MALLTDITEGSFSWVDLSTTDPTAAKAFYTGVFGWTFTDIPTDEASDYTMFQHQGHNACGMYQLPAEILEQGIPASWNSYIAAGDVDAMTRKAVSLGAKIVQEPFDVMDVGRMSVITDPDGAVFSLWQDQKPCEEGEESIVNIPNTWCWNELYCNNPETETRFYEELCGWSHSISKSPMGLDYITFRQGSRESAGMLQIQPEWGEMPPAWGVYFNVSDIRAIMDRVIEHGGKVMMDPMMIPNVGEFTSIADPQGAFFNIIGLEHIDD
jgi:hypothetical protein